MSAESLHPWKGYIPSFRVWGNLYFVGTYHASTHIIDTGDGLIMLDSGYQHSLYLVLQNMHTLTLDPMDIKYIVHTHGHIDHCGATRALVEMTGAKTFLGTPDKDYVNGVRDLSWAKELDLELEEFDADVLVNDGDTITLGNTTLTAVATPGHTPGAMSYLFNVYDGEKMLVAGIHGGAGMNTFHKAFLDRYGLSYDCRENYLKSMDRLKSLKVDIFLGNHAWHNQTREKQALILAGDKNAFVDPEAWGKFAEKCQKDLYTLLEKEKAAE
ncbi:MAG: MBL fold metallo-hydrolase [Oscillospiraceae bacterium]|nr:MBL fold metallo-hydrolase [Oscillospiraceae bacterium]